jgi:hypothetical protein
VRVFVLHSDMKSECVGVHDRVTMVVGVFDPLGHYLVNLVRMRVRSRGNCFSLT